MVRRLKKILKREKLLELSEKILQRSYLLIFLLFCLSFLFISFFIRSYYSNQRWKQKTEIIIQRDFIEEFKKVLKEREGKLEAIRNLKIKDPFF